jgi:hypothetical protein
MIRLSADSSNKNTACDGGDIKDSLHELASKGATRLKLPFQKKNRVGE